MRKRTGFTLVELLVTTSMLTLFASAGYVVLSAGVRSAQKARGLNTMVAHAERALTAIARDIRAAVEHDEVRLTSLDAQFEGRDADTIDFIATRTRRGEEEPGATGRCEAGYYIDNDPYTEAQWLLRREDSTIDEEPLEVGILSLAAPCVSELNLEFFDGLLWLSGWDDPQHFPRGVRIGVVVVDANEIEDPLCFETTVSVPAR